MMPSVCTFCGSTKVGFWDHRYAVCDSRRCFQRYLWATWEPRLEIWMEPMPLQRAWAWLKLQAMRVPCALIPVLWILRDDWRGRLSVWAHGGAYWLEERAQGKV